jgi:hypothetical protein
VVDGVTLHSNWNTAGKIKVRLGKLTGITAVVNEYGLMAGNGFAATDQWIKASSSGVLLNNTPIKIYNGATQTVNIDANGTDIWIGPSSSDKRLTWNGTTFAVKGEITAESGYIGTAAGGWAINTTNIASTNMRLVAAPSSTNARIEVGDYAGASGYVAGIAGGALAATNIAFWAGAAYADRATAPFRVQHNGAIVATSATISGDITANTGYIGGAAGWTIASGLLSSSNVKIYSGNTTLARIELGTGTDANTAGMRGGDGTAAAVAFWAGATHTNRATAPFRAYLDGRVFATNANISGDFSVGSSTYGAAGIQLQYNAGSPRLYAGNGSDKYIRWDGTDLKLSGIVDGALYVTGSVYAGNGNVRMSTDGHRLLLVDSAAPDIPTSSSALRWMTSLTAAWSDTQNYAGFVTYRNTNAAYQVVDLTLTSYVGSTNANDYDARVILQAGHNRGGTYEDANLVVARNRGTTGGVITANCGTFTASNNVYVTSNMSAQSITDRTPAYDGNALADLRRVRSDRRGGIDHSSLPAFARKQVRRPDGSVEEGRDLGAMISVLTRAVQELDARLDAIGA